MTADRGKQKYLERNLSQCFARYTSRTDCTVVEPDFLCDKSALEIWFRKRLLITLSFRKLII
jgi:hypothetical protein